MRVYVEEPGLEALLSSSPGLWSFHNDFSPSFMFLLSKKAVNSSDMKRKKSRQPRLKGKY